MTERTEAHLSPEQLSRRWGGRPNVRTLAQWRYLGKGPDYIKIGRAVLYSLSEVVEYERRNTRTTASAA